MTDLVDDDILYSSSGNWKDNHWYDHYWNKWSYNWCSSFDVFTDVVYKSYRVEKQKRDEVDPYDMVYHNLQNKHFVLCKVKPCGYCICRMFLMSYDNCSWARLIGMSYILESTSDTSTLIFPYLAWELILIDNTTLLKDQEYIHSGYMDRCSIA
jgi:hypothetical protein